MTEPGPHISSNAIWIAVIAGLSYAASLILWSQAIEASGIALTVGITRLAIIIPVLSSIFIWKEIPRWHQAVGIVIGLLASLIIGREGTRAVEQSPDARHRSQLVMVALFIAAGVANLSSKLFQELCNPAENYQFQALLFIVAFAATTIIFYRQKNQASLPVLQWGSLLGAVNLGSSIFIILALRTLTGTIAFPISAALEVAAIALLGRFVWKEQLSRLSIIGLVLTIVALILVQLR